MESSPSLLDLKRSFQKGRKVGEMQKIMLFHIYYDFLSSDQHKPDLSVSLSVSVSVDLSIRIGISSRSDVICRSLYRQPCFSMLQKDLRLPFHFEHHSRDFYTDSAPHEGPTSKDVFMN